MVKIRAQDTYKCAPRLPAALMARAASVPKPGQNQDKTERVRPAPVHYPLPVDTLTAGRDKRATRPHAWPAAALAWPDQEPRPAVRWLLEARRTALTAPPAPWGGMPGGRVRYGRALLMMAYFSGESTRARARKASGRVRQSMTQKADLPRMVYKKVYKAGLTH